MAPPVIRAACRISGPRGGCGDAHAFGDGFPLFDRSRCFQICGEGLGQGCAGSGLDAVKPGKPIDVAGSLECFKTQEKAQEEHPVS